MHSKKNSYISKIDKTEEEEDDSQNLGNIYRA